MPRKPSGLWKARRKERWCGRKGKERREGAVELGAAAGHRSGQAGGGGRAKGGQGRGRGGGCATREREEGATGHARRSRIDGAAAAHPLPSLPPSSPISKPETKSPQSWETEFRESRSFSLVSSPPLWYLVICAKISLVLPCHVAAPREPVTVDVQIQRSAVRIWKRDFGASAGAWCARADVHSPRRACVP